MLTRWSVRVQVQCSKCGWKSRRSVQVVTKRQKTAEEAVLGDKSYRHLFCDGVVLAKRVLGSHALDRKRGK